MKMIDEYLNKKHDPDEKPEPSSSTIGQMINSVPIVEDDKWAKREYAEEMLNAVGNPDKLRAIKKKYREQGVDVDRIGFV